MTGSAVVQRPDELLVRPGGGGGPRAEVAPPRVHGLHGLAAAEEAAAEAGVSVVHDAVAVVPGMTAHYYPQQLQECGSLCVEGELHGVPGVVHPLVRQHVEVVDPHVLVPAHHQPVQTTLTPADIL